MKRHLLATVSALGILISAPFATPAQAQVFPRSWNEYGSCAGGIFDQAAGLGIFKLA